MKLVERHIIKKINPYYEDIDKLCFLSKNVFNSTLYVIKQAFSTKQHIPTITELDRLWRTSNNVDYRALPYSQCAQQTMRCTYSLLTSFFRQIKLNNVKHKVSLPRYKDSIKGRYKCAFTNQCIKIKDNIIYIKVNKEGKYFTLKTNKTNIKQIVILPLANSYAVDVIYEAKDREKKQLNNRFASIDLGIDNLCTLASNCCQSTIYDGKRLKSINRFYNKRKGELQSKLKENKHTSKRIRLITNRRNNKVKDYLHKTSSAIVNYLISNDITCIIIGKNDKWKDSCNIGKKNNQNFISIPHSRLIQMIEYKCSLEGITVIKVNEAYTSKCSFLDNEKICKHEVYKGKRINRGLFKSSKGILINADVNGAYNIMILGIKKLKCNCDAVMPADMRFVYNPVKVQLML